MTTTRRLAAILAADVAGYSRLMAADEVGTLEALKASRREIVDPAIVAHSGRIVKTTGDGMLVEFASAVDAVTCAMAVQTRMAQRTNEPRIAFRIGINVGDIIIDGDDIFGDGVNVAARVEGECEPGSVCLSGNALEQVRNKTAFAFDDLGERPLKNIDRPIRIYAIRTARSAAMSEGAAFLDPSKPLALPDKPSIAVLPFQNMSGDPEQEYFADGMVEDIITALSRFKSLFVIARNSSFTYKGKAVDIKQVGRELGVRYVLEGSVRKAGGRVRITGQLIEAASGIHIWADKYDGGLDDVFDLQDRVTSNVVASISPKLMQAEIELARKKPTASLTAYDCYLRGLDHFYRDTQEGLETAFLFLRKAIDLDPSYAAAYALAGRTFARRVFDSRPDGSDAIIREGEQYVRKAIALAQDDEIALSHAGIFFSLTLRDHETARILLDQAIALNPNLRAGLTARAWVSINLGDHADAIQLLDRSMRRNPLDPQIHFVEEALAHAHFFLHEFDKSLEWSAKILGRKPDHLSAARIATLALALSGQVDKALQMRSRLPASARASSITEMSSRLTFRRAEDVELWREAGRRLGLPE